MPAVASRTPTSLDPELFWMAGFRQQSDAPPSQPLDDLGDVKEEVLDDELDEHEEDDGFDDDAPPASEPSLYFGEPLGDVDELDHEDEPFARMFGEGRAALLGFDALPPASERELTGFWYRSRP